MARILFVTNSLHSQAGGAERVVINLSNALVEHGYEVGIVSLQNTSGPIFFDLRTNVSVFYVGSRANTQLDLIEKTISHSDFLRLFHKSAWRMRHSKTVRTLIRVVDHWNPDHVIAFSGSSLSISCAALDPKGRYKFIASIHNSIEAEFFDRSRWSSNSYDISLRRKAINKADLVTVLTDEFAQHYFLTKAKEVQVIPNFIENANLQKSDSGLKSKQVIAVGRLSPVKRFDLLIRSWQQAESQKHFKLLILGDGPEFNNLQRLIVELGLAGSVELMGAVKNPEEHISKSSVLVHPAKHEGFGLVVLEAMAMGVPAIAFASCTGVRSIIEDGQNGYLLDGEETPENLARHIDMHLNLSDYEKARMSDKAVSRYKAFSKNSIMEKWLTVLEQN